MTPGASRRRSWRVATGRPHPDDARRPGGPDGDPLQRTGLQTQGIGQEKNRGDRIDKNAISISKRHFPKVEQLGDITKLKARDIKPVDIITFGSPC